MISKDNYLLNVIQSTSIYEHIEWNFEILTLNLKIICKKHYETLKQQINFKVSKKNEVIVITVKHFITFIRSTSITSNLIKSFDVFSIKSRKYGMLTQLQFLFIDWVLLFANERQLLRN